MARQLSATERAVLNALLAQPFPGSEPLRTQALTAVATRGCDCGCGTVDLEPTTTAQPSGLPDGPAAEANIVVAGQPQGGVLLFVRNGLLDRLEVYSYEQPLPMPAVEHLSFEP